MAQEFNGYSQYCGVVVPWSTWDDVKIVGDETLALPPEANRIPGDATFNSTLSLPLTSSRLKISTSGEQRETQSLAVVKAGYPGLKGSSLRMAWKDEAGVWMGWEDHNVLRAICEEKLYCDSRNTYGSSPMIYEDNFCVISSGDGKALIFIASSQDVEMSVFNPTTMEIEDTFTVLATGATHYQGDLKSGPRKTTYVEPLDAILSDDGTITLFALARDESSAVAFDNDGSRYQIIVSRAQIGQYSSGSGWRTVSTISLDSLVNNIATDYEAFTLKAATNGKGEVVLFVMLTEDAVSGRTPIILYQYASSDGGLNWTRILFNASSPSSAEDCDADELFFSSIDVSYSGGTYFVVMGKILQNTLALTDSRLLLKRLSSPYASIESVTSEQINTSENLAVRKAITYIGSDGRIYINALYSETSDESITLGSATIYGDVISWASADGGDTFEQYIQSVAGSFGMTNYDVTDVNGHAISIYASCNSTLSEDTTHLMIAKSGGWTTYTHPRTLLSYPYQLASYGSLPYIYTLSRPAFFWLPICLPDSFGQFTWALSSGTVTNTITAGDAFMEMSYASSALGYYEAELQNCDWDSGFIFEGKIKHVSGGSFDMYVSLSDGGDRYKIGIRLTSTTLSIYDFEGGVAKSASPITIASGNIIHYKFAFRKGSAALYYYDGDGKLRLQEVYSGSWASASLALFDAVARVGRNTTAPSATTHHLYSFGFINRSGGGEQNGWNDDLATNIGTRYPAALYGGMLPIYGKGTMNLPSGLKLAGSGGWAQMGEYFDIEPTSPNPIDNVLIPSPTLSALVDNTSGDTPIVLNIMQSGSDLKTPIGPTFSLFVFNTDFRLFSISARDSLLGSWEDIGFLDLAGEETGLAYTLVGDTIYPNSPSGTSRHFEMGELVGSSVDFGSGVVRRIVSNSEGRWAQTGKTCWIKVEGDLSSLSQSGTMAICRREGGVILASISAGKSYKYLRVSLPPQATWRSGGYSGEIGTILFGPFVPFSTKYSSSRALTLSPQLEITTNRWGHKGIVEVGSLQKTVEFSWAEGFSNGQIKGSEAGDYISLPSGDEPAGSRGNSTIIEGILTQTKGGRLPLVYIPKLVPGDYSTEVNAAMPQFTLTGKNRGLLCHMTESTTSDVAGIGEEETNEVVRISGVRLVEVL